MNLSTFRPLAQVAGVLFLLLTLFFPPHPALAQNLIGKVVGVSDGDTIKVLSAEKREIKVRLDGVDAPEVGQPFGTAAKQFTSKAVFGQQVELVVKDTDRYGRTVAVVLVGGRNLNQSLVKNGMAWWYRQYAPNDASLRQLEAEARAAKIGIWSESKTAVAPWDWRRGKRPAAPKVAVTRDARGGAAAKAVSARTIPVTATVYITNSGEKYHESGCRHLRRSQIAISLKDAEAQGYSPCKHCH